MRTVSRSPKWKNRRRSLVLRNLSPKKRAHSFQESKTCRLWTRPIWKIWGPCYKPPKTKLSCLESSRRNAVMLSLQLSLNSTRRYLTLKKRWRKTTKSQISFWFKSKRSSQAHLPRFSFRQKSPLYSQILVLSPGMSLFQLKAELETGTHSCTHKSRTTTTRFKLSILMVVCTLSSNPKTEWSANIQDLLMRFKK